ncbi:hypothetical protein LIER_32796 [Lithospermum erythrorhizon]|uniref:Uncharacterized protein n=1 Tax=Lithospermum erythrorhizon TaxID=34254 RepID=A0AAV3RUX5_LITER
MEFNLVPGVDQKIDVKAFIEGLRFSKFNGYLLKKRPSSLEEINERAYKYIRIEETNKRAEKGSGKQPMEPRSEVAEWPRQDPGARHGVLPGLLAPGERLLAPPGASKKQEGK